LGGRGSILIVTVIMVIGVGDGEEIGFFVKKTGFGFREGGIF